MSSEQQFKIPELPKENKLGTQESEYPEVIPKQSQLYEVGKIEQDKKPGKWRKIAVGLGISAAVVGGIGVTAHAVSNAEAQSTTTTAEDDTNSETGEPSDAETEPIVSVPELTGEELVEAMRLEPGLTTGMERDEEKYDLFQKKVIKSVETWLNSGKVKEYYKTYQDSYGASEFWIGMEDIARKEMEEVFLPVVMNQEDGYVDLISKSYIDDLVEQKSKVMGNKVLQYMNEDEVNYKVELEVDSFGHVSGPPPNKVVNYTMHEIKGDSPILEEYKTESVDGIKVGVAFTGGDVDEDGDFMSDKPAVGTAVVTFGKVG